MKKYIPLIFVISLVIISGLAEYYSPKPLDWTASFNDDDERPFGKYLISRVADKMFRHGKIAYDSTFYQLCKESDYKVDSTKNNNYILIQSNLNIDKTSAEYLLKWVAYGNNVFIASSNFYSSLADSLHVETKEKFLFNYNFFDSTLKERIILSNPELKSDKPYTYYKASGFYYFSDWDTLKTTVLGTFSDGKVNFIKVKYGNGTFYISSVPFAFTNYNLVKDNNIEYAQKALSYLPWDNTTYWDQHESDHEEKSSTPIRFILSQPSLALAYYTALFAVCLFILIKTKRVQRIIPLVNPPENSTLKFAGTITNLYLHKMDNHEIALKKVKHFTEFIRSKYHMQTKYFDENYIETLSLKTGYNLKELREIFIDIDKLNKDQNYSGDSLLQLNMKIDNFYKRTNHGKYE